MTDQIMMQGDQVHVHNGEQPQEVLTVSQLVRRIHQSSPRRLSNEPIPDNVKWLDACGKLTNCVVELKPELRWVQWIRADSPMPFGPAAACCERQLATPYVILFVPFLGARPIPRIQVFYRNEPLRSLGDSGGMLYWPNLLNVSPHAYGCLAWFCSQHIRWRRVAPGVAASLDEVLHHLWGGQFNRSSEEHEGESTMSKAVQDGIDQRVTDVDRWEQESRKDPRFVLSVDWKSTGMTVGELIDRERTAHHVNVRLAKTSDLANLILRKHGPE